MLAAFSTTRSEEIVDASELAIVIAVAGDIVIKNMNQPFTFKLAFYKFILFVSFDSMKQKRVMKMKNKKLTLEQSYHLFYYNKNMLGF